MVRQAPLDSGDETTSVLHSLQLDDPSDSWMDQLLEAETASPYGCLGPYELLEEVGRGGQGIVYRSRELSTGRRVAVKRLLAGPFSSAGNRRRLERELEALLRLEHPGIVSGLSLEVVDSCSFLSMEWIDGVPVTDWCRATDRQRPMAEIVQMLIKVCDAVHHAHQHGVVHRDLKPSNILVDAEGAPHVIDFGLAKILDGHSKTMTGRFQGTAPYASLEQLYGDARDVDVRSDVYSLGIILYESITGSLPYGRARSAASIARAIEHEAPSPPTAGGHRIARDLEAVILKAIAKDRELRYQSVNSLADDLRRFLAQEPVEARVDTRWSRILRTLRRHPILTTAAAAAFTAVTALATATGVLGARAAEQRDAAQVATLQAAEQRDAAQVATLQAAEQRDAAQVATLQAAEQRDVAQAATLQAQEETSRAQAISDFLHRMLIAALPDEEGHDVTLREILDDASQEIGAGIEGHPLVEADIRNTIGTLYQQLGLYDRARKQLEAAVSVLREHLQPGDSRLAAGLNNLGNLRRAQGHYEQAEDLLREALVIRERVLGSRDFFVAESLNNLAGLVYRRGDYDSAASMYRQALDIQRALTDSPTARIAANLGNLADAVREQGDLPAAMALFEEALSMHREVQGKAHPDVALAMSTLGDCLSDQGQHERAEELQRAALEIYVTIMGEGHPRVASCLEALGRTTLADERYEESASWLRRALAVRTASLGEKHPLTAISYNNLGRVLLLQGEYTQAHDLLRQAIAIASEALPPDHWHTAGFRSNLGECLLKLERYAAAESELLASHSVLLATFGNRHARTQKVVSKLIELYEVWIQPERAAAWRLELDESKD